MVCMARVAGFRSPASPIPLPQCSYACFIASRHSPRSLAQVVCAQGRGLQFWRLQPEGSVLKPHLCAAAIRLFEYTSMSTNLVVHLALSTAQRSEICCIVGAALSGAQIWVFESRAAGRARSSRA